MTMYMPRLYKDSMFLLLHLTEIEKDLQG